MANTLWLEVTHRVRPIVNVSVAKFYRIKATPDFLLPDLTTPRIYDNYFREEFYLLGYNIV
jgi:hypothetical protein